MHHRAPVAARPDPIEVQPGGPVRIRGAYPPPLVHEQFWGQADIPDAEHPRVTRYDRSRHRAPRTHRPAVARAWAGTSAVLAAAGVAAVVLLPQDRTTPARLDVPVAAPATVAAPAPVVAPAPAAAAEPVAAPPLASPAAVLQLPASEPVRVQIPALGVRSQVMELGLERDGSMEVPPGGYPVGWYGGSPTPGELGPAVLAGHVDWDGEPGAFYGLRELLPGDEIVVERADGTTATFRVEAVEEHAKDDFPTDAVYDDIAHAGLRLITCGGSFDEDTGDYTENVIVFASLTSGG